MSAEIRRLLSETLMNAWCRHPRTVAGQWGTPNDVYFSVAKAVDALTPAIEKLLALPATRQNDQPPPVGIKHQIVAAEGDTVEIFWQRSTQTIAQLLVGPPDPHQDDPEVIKRLQTLPNHAYANNGAAYRERDAAFDLIRWTLGESETDEFPTLPDDWPKRKFYWRAELRRRFDALRGHP